VARHSRGAAWPTPRPATLPAAPLEHPDARPGIRCSSADARRGDVPLRTCGRDAPDEQGRQLTAKLFVEPTERWARERATGGGEVHRFKVEHVAPDPRLGALHTIDVPLLFGTFRTSEIARHFVADDDAARAVSARMQHAWARFLHGEQPWSDLYIVR
jgi:carboxylesterase type B